MEAVAAEVNAHAAAAGQAPKSVDEVAMGFVRVANETMCRPIRALTQMKVGAGRACVWGGLFAVSCTCPPQSPCQPVGHLALAGCQAECTHSAAFNRFCARWRPCLSLPALPCVAPWARPAGAEAACARPCLPQGYDVTQHVLACFGGAGGQHACAIAAALGMRTIFVHRYSGILSAVGIGLAEVVQEAQVTGQLDCGRKPACSLITSGPANTVTHGKPGRCSLIEQLGIHRAALNKLPTMPLNPHATHLSSHRSRLQLR